MKRAARGHLRKDELPIELIVVEAVKFLTCKQTAFCRLRINTPQFARSARELSTSS
jgi:hypothetical protein